MAVNAHSSYGAAVKGGKLVRLRNSCQPDQRSWVDSIIDVLLPGCCVCCGLKSDGARICRVCTQHLPWNTNPCAQCAIALPEGSASLCGSCQSRPPRFDGACAALQFRFPVNRLIHRFKFNANRTCGAALTACLVDYLVAVRSARPDLLVPVPMNRWRLMRRGINPAYDIAAACARLMDLPLAPHNLQRFRHTRTQKGLDAVSRRKNLKGAFRWRGPGLQGQDVVIVDDVMTTGSTFNECARMLKRAGASRVSVWALARVPQV